MSTASVFSDTSSAQSETNAAPTSNEDVGQRDNITGPKDIQVQLQYLKNDVLYDTVKPMQIVPNFADNEGKSNVKLVPGDREVLTDVRGTLNNFTLDNNGFKYTKSPTNFNDWTSQPAIAAEYLPELEDLLHREVEGCDEIIFFDARIRHESDEGVRIDGLSYNPFARQVHVDNTESSVLEKVKRLTDMKAEYLLKGRTQIINIWRPIKHPVYDCGLAVADGATLKPEDVRECDRVRKDTGQFWDTMGVVQYRPGFDWYYMSEQTEEDVLLFKNYDSSDTSTKHCLHTAFDLPSDQIPASAPTRESIEVRALVFTYPISEPKPTAITHSTPQHPLAVILKFHQLRSMEINFSIVDRARTDIDEASELELKDGALSLRRQEIKHLTKLLDEATEHLHSMQQELDSTKTEHAKSKRQLDLVRKHSQVQSKLIAAYEDQKTLRAAADSISPDQRMNEMAKLSQELAEARLGISGDESEHECTNEACNKEKVILIQNVDGLKRFVDRMKAESVERGIAAANEKVAEGVRQERKKDEPAVHNFVMEIGRLREERDQALAKVAQLEAKVAELDDGAGEQGGEE